MPARQAVATIVASDAVTKLEALDVLSRVTGSPVEGARTPAPRVSLGPGAWAQIDIPKFGEPPPLAIDVYVEGEESEAQRHALTLAERLRAEAGWSVLPAFAVV
jgi:hypothetical protein